MGRETGGDESKKECPSCGLGVSVEANICEFCGWDFEEEDEWILQIEKLERDLLLEKQKFEPGSVDQKIESTLRNPLQERVEAEKAGLTKREPEPREPERPEVIRVAEQMIDRERPEPAPVVPVRAPEPAPPPARAWEPARVQPAPPEASQPKVRKVREVKAPPPAPVAQPQPRPPQQQAAAPTRQLRKVRSPPPAQPAEQPEKEPQTRKAKAIRKVKG